MKRVLLTTTAIALLGAGMIAQNKRVGANAASAIGAPVNTGVNPNRCSTPVPAPEWDAEFNKMVENYKKTLPAGKASSTTYTIPIIFHIIYTQGEAVGSGHNISQAQVNSQIPILNADYNGTGYNTSLYANMTSGGHPAFYDYAQSASLPAPDNNGVVIAASGVYFCLAKVDKNGATLAEPGIERITWNSISGATNPQSSSNIQTLFDNTIKPATIWDPTKYFNVWVSDGGTSGLLGYATFPPGTTLSGLSGTGTSTTDGVWVAYNALGNTGAVVSPYNLGRSLTHESGHWLGLRHIWGDGTCATDYCNDTPPAKQANFVNCGTAYPYNANSCPGTPPNGNGADGEMYMNFMDYSNDCGMWMFTTDQVTRIHTALAQSPYRSGLTNSAVTECNLSSSTPVAAFNTPAQLCAGTAATFTDVSTGPPTSWSWSVTPNTGVTITTSTSQNPSITFANTGTYTVSLTATNSNGNNSVSHTVSVANCASTCDTMKNITNLSSIALYYADAVAPHDSGFLSGTNAYGDKAKAEKYAYLNNGKQLKGIRAYLYVKGTGNVTFNVWNDNAGKPGTVVASKTVALNTLVTGYNNIMLTSAITPPATFYVGFNIPTTSGDTIAVATNNASTGGGTAGTGFEQWSDNSWNDYTTVYSPNTISNYLFPFLCPQTGINEMTLEGVYIFPNPNNGVFNIALNLPAASDINVNVTDMLGQSVYQKLERGIANGTISLDLSSMSKGVYFVNVTDNTNRRMVQKIIIQ